MRGDFIPVETDKERTSPMWKEFRDFAMRGNVVDLAVGIIIGAAFTGIVNSLVNDIVMPIIGALVKGLDFSNYFLVLSNGHGGGAYPTLKAAKDAGAATLNYGIFLNTVLNFVIVAFVIFIIVKQLNRFKNVLDAAPTGPTTTEKLLTDIRDLLRDKPTVAENPRHGTLDPGTSAHGTLAPGTLDRGAR